MKWFGFGVSAGDDGNHIMNKIKIPNSISKSSSDRRENTRAPIITPMQHPKKKFLISSHCKSNQKRKIRDSKEAKDKGACKAIAVVGEKTNNDVAS